MRWLFFALSSLMLLAQTDETIFREFQFDFSTPGARANGMGGAFIGLADEGTIAYNNPAGLGVLSKPEATFEWRNNRAQFDRLEANQEFDLLSGEPIAFSFDIERMGFLSVAIPNDRVNFSLFYVNHLDYQRSPSQNGDQSRWINTDAGYEFSYFADHRVNIQLDTFGISVGKSIGKWSVGLVLGTSQLRLDYQYKTILFSDFFQLFESVQSNAKAEKDEWSWVIGSLYEVNPKWRVGLVYKRQPSFDYKEIVNNPQFPLASEPTTFDITFKVPDSINTGVSYQPNDVLTLVFDIDFIRYSQLGGDNLTLISGNDFSSEDYKTPNTIETHLGAEYLIPFENSILALRAGFFSDPDHKTRFTKAITNEEEAIQNFIFNTGTQSSNQGWTLGAGFVLNNKIQFDAALVSSDRFDWFIGSMLYRS